MINDTFETFKMQFGRQVAKLRKKKGLTQEQLARSMKMDTVSIAYIERANRGPSFLTIYKLAKALNVPSSKLFE